MKFTINLASRDYQLIKRVNLLLLFLSVIFLALFITNLFNLSSYKKREIMIKESLLRVKERENSLVSELKKRERDISKKGTKQLRKEVSFANGLITKRIFSWSSLLEELEKRVSPNIAISAIKPSSEKSTIVIEGVARSLNALTDFIIGLEDSEGFSGVFLTNQKEGEDDLLKFTINLRYQGE